MGMIVQELEEAEGFLLINVGKKFWKERQF